MTDPISSTSLDSAGRLSFYQMLPTLIFDVALPIVIFYLVGKFGAPTLWALVAGGLSPAINNCRVWIKSGRIEPLGIIVVVFLGIGTVTSLITGNVFFVLIKDSFLTAIFGLICLGSLVAKKPLMFYINRQFVAGDDPALLEWWNNLWSYQSFRAALRVVTIVWGVAYLIEALLRVILALVLSPAEVVTISPVMAFGLLIVLIVWTKRYMRASRERRVLEQTTINL